MKAEDLSMPVAVIGAGPVGLAAAAHLIDRGMTPLVLESGAQPATAFEATRHVRLFSPWRYNLDRAAVGLLEASGWRSPDLQSLPTAGEMIDAYLAALAALPRIRSALRMERRVTAIAREGHDKLKTTGRERAAFLIRTEGAHGFEIHRARAVIDASGTWASPNPLGADGLPAPGEAELKPHIFYGMPDLSGAARARYAGRRVLVVGAGHSAIGTLIALAELAQSAPGTRIDWAIRGDNLARILGGGTADGLPARGELGQRLKRLKDENRLAVHANFRTIALRDTVNGITIEGIDAGGGPVRIDGVDEIVCATGSRPDLSIASELRLKTDPWLEASDALAPLIDPNVHSCGTVRPHGHRELAHPEPGFYVIGAKSYGRAPNFLLATGYEQARSVVAALDGDMDAADDVRLELPETGVCSTDFAPKAATACCCGPAPEPENACCMKDAQAKAAGKSGCGCGPAATPAPPKPVAACCSR